MKSRSAFARRWPPTPPTSPCSPIVSCHAKLAADRLKRAQEQFGIARVRVQAGEAISSDSLQLLLEVNRARLAMLSRDSALATSRLRLGNQIGVPGAVDAAAIDTAVPPPLPLTQDEATAEMRARGPDVEAARADERRADAILGAERERYLPRITLGATTGAYDSELFPSALRRSQLAVTVSARHGATRAPPGGRGRRPARRPPGYRGGSSCRWQWSRSRSDRCSGLPR